MKYLLQHDQQKFVHRFYISCIIINWMVYFCILGNILVFISENIKVYLLGTHCTSIFVEYFQGKGVCLFENSNDVCFVW